MHNVTCPDCESVFPAQFFGMVSCPECGVAFDSTEDDLFVPPDDDYESNAGPSNDIMRVGARTKVSAPAAGLILAACLGILSNFTCVFLDDFVAIIDTSDNTLDMTDDQIEQQKQRRRSQLLFELMVFGTLSLIAYPIMLLGAHRMKQLRNYSFATAAAIMALLPCSIAWLISAPIGIWTLIVLNKNSVRPYFISNREYVKQQYGRSRMH